MKVAQIPKPKESHGYKFFWVILLFKQFLEFGCSNGLTKALGDSESKMKKEIRIIQLSEDMMQKIGQDGISIHGH